MEEKYYKLLKEYVTPERIKEYLSLIPLGAKAVYYTLKLKDEAKVTRIKFGKFEKQYFLVFKPKGKIKSDYTILFIHGGAWQYGSPEAFSFIGYYFASKGIPCIMPAYRQAPDYIYPAMEDDIYSSVKAILENKGELDIPVESLVIAGQSSGAHLGALLIYKKKRQYEFSINEKIFRNFISISGPLDLRIAKKNYGEEKVKEIMGENHGIEEANPINYISGDEDIPVLLIHAKNDPTVEITHSKRFAEKLNSSGKNLAKLVILDDFLHSDTVELFLDKQNHVDIIKWIEKNKR
jgi:acetyl esterase/lipase